MEQPAPKPRRYTVEEYLALEAASETRHEYRNGEIIAMAGALTNHNRITRNISRRLAERLEGTDCENFGENQRVRVDRTRYCYPDQTVACLPLIYDPPDGSLVLTNPRVIFEVSSESTEQDDRTTKFYRYLRIESLQEYVLISQDKKQVETFYRQPDGVWAIGGMVDDPTGTVRLRSLGIDLKIEDVYDRVEFAAPVAPSARTKIPE
jgi:Uma2 family endonuclease